MQVIKFYILSMLLLCTSCATKYQGREPDFTPKKTNEAVKEYELFKIQPYSIPMPHYSTLKFRGKPTAPEDIEHVLAATKPGTLRAWRKHHWGAYMAWVAAIPFAIFAANTASDFNFTNLFLLGASATAFGYGSYLEQQHKNRIINGYNRELKIKLNLIKSDF